MFRILKKKKLKRMAEGRAVELIVRSKVETQLGLQKT